MPALTILAIVAGTLAADYCAARVLDRLPQRKAEREADREAAKAREAERVRARRANYAREVRGRQIDRFRGTLNPHATNDQLINAGIGRLLALDDLDGAHALCHRIEAERRP